MPNITSKRIESDVRLKLTLKSDGVSIAWDTVTIRQICMFSTEQNAFAGHCSFSIDEEDSTILNVLYPADEQLYTGDHRVVARLCMDSQEVTYDALAFKLVSYTDSDGSVDTEAVEVGIEVEDVTTTIMYEIIANALAATNDANAAASAATATNATIVSAEASRVSAENAREGAEASRAVAEAGRVAAETSRAEQASADHATAVSDHAVVEGYNARLSTAEQVLPEHIAKLLEEIRGLASVIDNLGDARAKSLTIDSMLQICGSSLVVTGEGAPSSIPDFIGQEYLDMNGNVLYKAFGTTSVLNWVAVN